VKPELLADNLICARRGTIDSETLMSRELNSFITWFKMDQSYEAASFAWKNCPENLRSIISILPINLRTFAQTTNVDLQGNFWPDNVDVA